MREGETVEKTGGNRWKGRERGRIGVIRREY